MSSEGEGYGGAMPDFPFFFHSIALGLGLAMDAFSVSLANGLNEPLMKRSKTCGIAGLFAFFQFLMPLLGWLCIRFVLQYFRAFERLIPWIALGLLLFIGGKMILDGIWHGEEEKPSVGICALLLQGVATSIDALSVGFTIADYNAGMAVLSSVIIGVVTFGVCLAGLFIGKKFGTHLAGKASVLGGIILVAIGIEIFLSGILNCG